MLSLHHCQLLNSYSSAPPKPAPASSVESPAVDHRTSGQPPCCPPVPGSYSRVRAHLLGIKNAGIAASKKASRSERAEKQRVEDEFEKKKSDSGPREVPLPAESKEQTDASSKKRKSSFSAITRAFGVEARDQLDQEIARMFYTGGLPFNLARNPHYQRSYNFAPSNNLAGYIPPGYNKLRTTLLQQEKTHVERLLEPIKLTWKEKGVTVMSDGWSDPTRKPLINFMATSGNGPMFLKAVNCFGETKTAFFIADLMKDIINEVGHQNVVQMVTDNARNCKAAGEIIESQFPHIYWTPCVVHTLNLALKNTCAAKNVDGNEETIGLGSSSVDLPLPKMKRHSTYNNKVKTHTATRESLKLKNSKRPRIFDSKIEVENGFDVEIESEVSDSGDDFFMDENGGKGKENDEEDELQRETVEERRRRLAWELVQKVRKGEQERKDEEDNEEEEREEKQGNRDSLVAKIMLQEQLEESGRARRLIASKLEKPEAKEEPQLWVKNRQSVTAVTLSDDDRRGFSASKDGYITHWDVEVGKSEKYLWPTEEVLMQHDLHRRAANVKNPKGRTPKHSKSILALAVSSDGRYLATGGLDRHVHIWDTRTREHIKAFYGHKGPVSCLAFRQGTSEIFSGSFDRTLKIWNAEGGVPVTTLFGHQSEVLSMDCMRKERVLTVGRDRTLQLYKVPEESCLVYRASASSLECCCFVGNDEFLSGSDDGSIELWSMLRKKPVFIVRNAHRIPSLKNPVDLLDNGRMANGRIENSECKANNPCSTAQSWVSSVTVCRNSDLAASGAGNGCVRLWTINSDNKGIEPLFDVPLVGYVNSLAIAKSGRFLVAGVGQEPRLGRWDRLSTARNGVYLQPFKLTS